MAQQNLGLRQFARDSVINLIRRWWSLLVGIVISAVVARGLGVDNRGLYAVVLLLSTLLIMVANSGVSAAIVYYTARREHPVSYIVQQNFAFSIWMGCAATIVGGLLVRDAHTLLFPDIPVDLLLVSLMLVPITLIYQNTLSIFQGLENFRTYNLIELISQLILLGATVLLVWVLPLGVEGAILAIVIGRMASLVLLYYVLFRQPDIEVNLTLRLQLRYGHIIAGYAGRAYFANIASFLNYRADVFLLNLLGTGTAAIGYYDIAVVLAEKMWTISQAASLVIFPRIAALEGAEHYRKRLTSLVARHIFWFSLIVGIALGILAEWVIVLIYGVDFAPSAAALRWLMPGIVTWTVTSVLAQDFAGRGNPQVNAFVASIGLVINVAFNVILIPQLDYVGASLSTSISYTVVMLVLLLIFTRTTDVVWYQVLFPTRDDVRLWKKALGLITARFQNKTSPQ